MLRQLPLILYIFAGFILSGCKSESVTEFELEKALLSSTESLQGVLVFDNREENYEITLTDAEVKIEDMQVIYRIEGDFTAQSIESDISSQVEIMLITQPFNNEKYGNVVLTKPKLKDLQLPNIHQLLKVDYANALSQSLNNVLSVRFNNTTIIDYSKQKSEILSGLNGSEKYSTHLVEKRASLKIMHNVE